MRNFLLFLMILASKVSCACGFYPCGEDTRISLFNPISFGYSTYAEFYYSSHYFGSYFSNSISYPADYTEPNVQLWFDYCKGKADIYSVLSAVYKLYEDEIEENSPNAMIQYLYKQKDNEALNYLRFAKNCEFFNSWQEDPWERHMINSTPKRNELIKKAVSLSEKAKNLQIRRRYAFLAIRLAWYSGKGEIIKSLFETEFEKCTDKDIIYYWSLYFHSFVLIDSARINFDLAQVFANAPDKRFVCHQNYNKKVPVDRVLQYAENDNEKANVYLLAGIERSDKVLSYLKKMYEYNPSSEGLSFLLLREINKIEDYVLTPYYTLFQPSISPMYWDDTEEPTIKQTLDRAERDRSYASDVLQFINTVDLQKVENPVFWQICKAYLQFITRDYSSSLSLINRLEKSVTDNELLNQLAIIKALVLTANQPAGKAVIPAEIKATLMANQNNVQFIFAIGKELEYSDNTSDAVLLYSKLDDPIYSEDRGYYNMYVFWKTLKNKRNTYSDYFSDYFGYVDEIYTPEQIRDLIENIQENKNNKDSFSIFLYEDLKEEIPLLYDLLGTKYIRQNKLENALSSFEKVGIKYWSRAYTTWEEYSSIFDKNPFYCIKYTPDFIVPKDTIRLNKYTITKQLIEYLRRAEDTNEKDRDYYYFLVANAYYNMGREGNVWMMRRFGYWSKYSLSAIEDETEFRQSNLAKKYYLLAKQYAKTDKFKALCLRMVIRCEKHKIEYMAIENWDLEGSYIKSLFFTNKYYLELKTNYPDYFDDLVSNCDNFEEYFEARR